MVRRESRLVLLFPPDRDATTRRVSGRGPGQSVPGCRSQPTLRVISGSYVDRGIPRSPPADKR